MTPGESEARWIRSYPVLGVETVVEATDPVVGSAVERAFGVWADAVELSPGHQRVRLRITVSDHGGERSAHEPVRYHLEQPTRLHVAAPGATALVDADAGDAWARVSRTLVADVDQFRYVIVEAAVFFMLSHRDRQPFHCAALSRGGTAVLLSGPPGVGKSTLAYAALRRGLPIMAEDMVWIERRPVCRIWGLTPVIHLPEGARREHPELADAPTLVANGVRKIAVDIQPRLRARPPVVNRGRVCVLARSETAPRLERINRADVAQALQAAQQPGFDLFPSTIPAVVEAFAPQGGWRLYLGGDPAAAAACLQEALERGSFP